MSIEQIIELCILYLIKTCIRSYQITKELCIFYIIKSIESYIYIYIYIIYIYIDFVCILNLKKYN